MSGLFTVAGVSTCEKGHTKVRFANDLPTRIKVLVKAGHTDIELIDLPSLMTKVQACEYLAQLGGVFSKHVTLLRETADKKEAIAAPKAPKAPKVPKVSTKKVAAAAKVKAASEALKEKDEDLLIEELKALAGDVA